MTVRGVRVGAVGPVQHAARRQPGRNEWSAADGHIAARLGAAERSMLEWTL